MRVFLFEIQKNQVPDDSTPVNRREFVLRLLSTPTNKELRCQVNIKAILVVLVNAIKLEGKKTLQKVPVAFHYIYTVLVFSQNILIFISGHKTLLV